MTKRIAINGFGRIGRAAFRINHMRKNSDIEIVAINDLTDTKTLAHLLKYDSVHRRFDANVKVTEKGISVDGREISCSAQRDPSQLAWKDLDIDVVLESTGVFRDKAKASAHLTAGAKKVLISAPASGGIDSTICCGINNSDYKSEHTVVSTASCTTNCLAPVAKVLNDAFGIDNALLTTVHSYTNDQRILDLPHKKIRRARAAAQNIIPTTTGAAKAISLVLPELDGKFDGMAIRVPTPNVSLVDLTIVFNQDVTAESINAELKKASEGKYKEILGYTDEELVSTDFLGTNHSSIIDSNCTAVQGKRLAKVLAWYDNEWGFTNRAVDLLSMLAKG